MTAAFLMVFLTGTEMVAATVRTWGPPASSTASAKPVQKWGGAEGLSHRVPAGATTAEAEGNGGPPQEAPGQLPPEEPRERWTPGNTAREPETGKAEVLDEAGSDAGEPEVPGFDERTSEELVEERDARSRTFRNEDGTRTTRFYDEQVNFRLRDGSWQEIDATLRAERPAGLTAHSGTGWVTTSTEVDIRFAADARSEPLAELRLDDEHAVAYSLRDAEAAEGIAEGAVITYPEALPGADLEFIAAGDGIKETMILHGPDAPRQWTFLLRLEGLTAGLDEDGNVAFVDADGGVRAIMPAGWMEDSAFGEHSGQGEISGGVEYELVEEGNGHTVLIVTLDDEWLDDTERVYPVKVDPSITRVEATSSTYVQKPYNQNFSTDTVLKVGTYDGGTHTAASFLRFAGVETTLKDAWVLDARLALYNTWSYSCTARPVTVHPITQNWSAATLKNYPGPSTGAALGSRSFANAWRPSGTTSWSCAPK
ncbi:DNRLRE domain-containing protein [Streptomyces sodiiphilus]|uniref:DNRLRE domain-containing protein n=1 Tax=Streptomyces sodiiphilus TaxID=226217 RepID=UPI0031D3AEAD